MKALFRTLLVTLLGAASGAQACEYCLISQGISPLQTQNGAGVKLAQRYTRLDSVYQGRNEVDNPGVKEQYWTTELGAFYSLTDRFLMLLNVPLRKTKGNGELVEGPDGAPEREDVTGEATGLGDVSVLGRYTLFARHTLDTTTLLAGVAGIKFPTGSTSQHSDQGEYLDSHLQLGTGSTDPLLGLSATHVLGRYTLSANLLAAFPGKGETGDTSHKFGTSVNYDVTGKYRLSPSVIGASSIEWFASLGVNGEYRQHEKLAGEKLDDTGGQTIYATPGIQCVVGSHWVVEGAYQYAVFHDLNETQLGEDYKVVGSVTYLF
jgi:hypothetical protein